MITKPGWHCQSFTRTIVNKDELSWITAFDSCEPLIASIEKTPTHLQKTLLKNKVSTMPAANSLALSKLFQHNHPFPKIMQTTHHARGNNESIPPNLANKQGLDLPVRSATIVASTQKKRPANENNICNTATLLPRLRVDRHNPMRQNIPNKKEHTRCIKHKGQGFKPPTNCK